MMVVLSKAFKLPLVLWFLLLQRRVIFTVRNSSCRKVMFLQACVKKSVRGVMTWQGACVAGETATAADGTHPTGMHSCLRKFKITMVQRWPV